MTNIKAKNASFVFPLLGRDSRFPLKLEKKSALPSAGKVGGDIVRTSSGFSGVLALDSLNFEIQSGTRLGLRGHNGAGKSTLLKAMAGIFQPTEGSLTKSGSVASLFNLSLGLNREVSGYDNIILKGLMYGLRKYEIEALVPEIHDFSELGEYVYMPVKTYSSGMIMRLLFATATCLKPDIMLLDEWISAGDPAFRKKVDIKMKEMMSTVGIVVVASHDDKRLEKWSNRIMTLESGRIILDET